MTRLIIALLALGLVPDFSQAQSKAKISDKDIQDAYFYFIGRLLVLRQEHLDFKNDFKWNTLLHRDVGKVTWANPNLDVAYSEAWLAIDKNSCAIIDMPKIENRYYTFQVLNSWGETVSNINERNYPDKPFGKFAYCTPDSTVKISNDITKILLTGHKFRVLARIELGANPAEATNLQKSMKLSMEGKPQIAKAVSIPLFENNNLIGVEAFDQAVDILKSEPDINPGMEPLQEKVQRVATAVKDPKQRENINKTIKASVIPKFMSLLRDTGKTDNGWLRPNKIGNYGSSYQDRSMVNYAGIWANNNQEAIYFGAQIGPDGEKLRGNEVYTMTFPKNQMPQSEVKYFWSVIAVDSEKFHVIPNQMNKYLINSETQLKTNPDGSITIAFASELPLGIDRANWIPTVMNKPFNLTFRMYGPKNEKYFPPALKKLDRTFEAQEERRKK